MAMYPMLMNFSSGNRPECKHLLMRYQEAKTIRSPYEPDWRMSSAYALPRHYSGWSSADSGVMTGNSSVGARRYAYDSTAARALPKFAAIMRRLATPDGHRWERLQATDPYLRKSYRVRAYFDELNDMLFRVRYNPFAGFSMAVDEMYTGLGCYGTSPVRLMWRRATPTMPHAGLAYKANPLKDIFFLANADGWIDTCFLRMWLTARQIEKKWPGVAYSKSIAAELSKPMPSETTLFEIVHCIMPRDEDDYNSDALTVQRHPFMSHYVVVMDAEYIGPESGFKSFPYMVPRTATEPGELYGFSPMQQALPAAGSVNQMKRTLLRQGQKAVDPPLLASDDGVISGRLGQTPGYVNYGAVNAQGDPLVHAMPPGNFAPAIELLQDEREDINDAFLVTLFQILLETPEMTATEVIERTSEKAALAAPSMARLQNGFLGPEVGRALDLIAENAPNWMPVMPPELVEAAGEYETVYTSPLAKGLHAEEDSGFMRVAEVAINAATNTQSPEPLDYLDFDAAIPEIAEHQSVPTRWIRSDDAVAEIRQKRQTAQGMQQMVEAAPAIASVAATSAKMGRAA